MKDPEYAKAILVEMKPERSLRERNMPRDLPRSAVEFVQITGIHNPEPAPPIFTAVVHVVAAEARRIVRIVGIVADSSGLRI
jgi:hypothetical protein